MFFIKKTTASGYILNWKILFATARWGKTKYPMEGGVNQTLTHARVFSPSTISFLPKLSSTQKPNLLKLMLIYKVAEAILAIGEFLNR
jgi:hypothetical protein